MQPQSILDVLQHRIVVADGAFGTLLYDKGVPLTVCYDHLNSVQPDLVRQIHREYLEAGAELIETNTFGANRWKLQRYELAERVSEINRRGAELALECAQGAAWVAGSIGPLGRLDESALTEADKQAIFREQAQALLDGGVHLLMLETFNTLADLLLAVKAVKALGDIPAIAQLVFTESGRTIDGDGALTAFARLQQAGADIVGANCGIGPNGILKVLKPTAAKIAAPVSALPNAGFPERRDDRMIYLTSPDYLAHVATELVNAGVNLIGGCCGTSPADIRAIKAAVAGLTPRVKQPVPIRTILARGQQPSAPTARPAPGPPTAGPERPHLEDLLGRRKVISVELDPPKTFRIEKVLQGAKALKQAGADVISIAENPLAMVRLSNVTMARRIQQEVGIETIVHLTGRDRNLIGMQSELMGMAIDGLPNILAVTGDPPSKGEADRVQGVFDLRSFELISLLYKLNQGQNFSGDDLKHPTSFTIGAAFNPNTPRLAGQVKRMRKKIELGAQFFQTQPVYDRDTVDRILEHTQDIDAPILLGILPLVSSRNAEFLHNEFPGISIPADVREKMRQAGKDGVQQGIEVAWELIRYAYPHFAGIYIMPPFNKYPIAVELIRRLTLYASETQPAEKADK